MSYFELILQRPIENLPALFLIIMGFFDISRRVLGFLSGLQKDSKDLQAGSQAIISQDNTLQSKLIEFIAGLQKEMVDRRVSDEQFKSRLLDVMDEKISRIDATTLLISGTTLATGADVKAVAAKMEKLDKAMGIFYQSLKKKGLI